MDTCAGTETLQPSNNSSDGSNGSRSHSSSRSSRSSSSSAAVQRSRGAASCRGSGVAGRRAAAESPQQAAIGGKRLASVMPSSESFRIMAAQAQKSSASVRGGGPQRLADRRHATATAAAVAASTDRLMQSYIHEISSCMHKDSVNAMGEILAEAYIKQHRATQGYLYVCNVSQGCFINIHIGQ